MDSDPERRAWLCTSLEDAGFAVSILDKYSDKIGRAVQAHNPQVVLITPHFGLRSSQDTTSQIMDSFPVPIVLLSNQQNISLRKQATSCGATTVLPEPAPPGCPGHAPQMEQLCATLQLMHEIPVMRHIKRQTKKTPARTRNSGSTGKRTRPLTSIILGSHRSNIDALLSKLRRIRQLLMNTVAPSSPCRETQDGSTDTPCDNKSKSIPSTKIPGKNSIRLVAIASSTGGPSVLGHILSKLPADYPIPILVVQHISESFASTLEQNLASVTMLPVKQVQDGQKLLPGAIYLAVSQYHVEVSRQMTIKFLPRFSIEGHCPSATAMFNSLAKNLGSLAIGIILSGMGNDGSEGLYNLKKAGGFIIAQHEATCVIDSMPRQAIALGAVSSVQTPSEIAASLLSLAEGTSSEKTSSPLNRPHEADIIPTKANHNDSILTPRPGDVAGDTAP